MTLGGLGHPGGVMLQVITGVGRHRCAARPIVQPGSMPHDMQQVARSVGSLSVSWACTLLSASSPLLACNLACSAGNQPRVLPAVVRYLSDAGYKFEGEEGNPGIINVAIGC